VLAAIDHIAVRFLPALLAAALAVLVWQLI
jgi:hypothetical protein